MPESEKSPYTIDRYGGTFSTRWERVWSWHWRAVLARLRRREPPVRCVSSYTPPEPVVDANDTIVKGTAVGLSVVSCVPCCGRPKGQGHEPGCEEWIRAMKASGRFDS